MASGNQNSDDLMHVLNYTSLLSLNSDYIDTNRLQTFQTCSNSSQLTILHLNVQGLQSKVDKLCNLLNELSNQNSKVHVVMLCETWLNDHNTSMCKIPGYTLVHRNRSNFTRGGVAMYILDGIPFTNLNVPPHVEKEFESIVVEIIIESTKLYLSEVYRVPNTNELKSIEMYQEHLQFFFNKRNVFIGTDQNFDLLKYNTHTNTQKLFDLFTSNGFIPSATKPTRLTHISATLIDNIYIKTNHNANHKSAIIMTDISDHFPIIFTTAIKIPHISKTKIKRRSLLRQNQITQIENEWQTTNWNFLTDTRIEQAFKTFYELLVATFDKHIPVTEKYIKSRQHHPWITLGIRRSIRKKRSSLQEIIKTTK